MSDNTDIRTLPCSNTVDTVNRFRIGPSNILSLIDDILNKNCPVNIRKFKVSNRNLDSNLDETENIIKKINIINIINIVVISILNIFLIIIIFKLLF